MLPRLRRLAGRFLRLARLATGLVFDQFRCTYSLTPDRFSPVLSPGLRAHLEPTHVERERLARLAQYYLEHRFDMLGSGWRQWNRPYGPSIRSTFANRRMTAVVRGEIVGDYQAIDWHCDRRSGYRFPATRWARLIRPGPRKGVDIKVPWELSRMQHLLQLALLAIDEATDAADATAFHDEVDNQIRDFIAANPPRFGVNWRVAMDVAIRAANWVLALSVLHAGGRDIASIAGRAGASLRDHGRFIIEHLEWDPHCRGNHYLANLCGLAFIAAALPADDETNAWLRFAAGELLAEGVSQIHADGSGFEASTAYHRLSLDMLVNASALLLGIDARRWRAVREGSVLPLPLPRGFVLHQVPWQRTDAMQGTFRWPDALVVRLSRAAAFTRAVSRPDGRALLIGDNDSGRFFKPCPRLEVVAEGRFRERFVDAAVVEDIREVGADHAHLVDALDALFGGEVHGCVEARIVRALARGRSLERPTAVPAVQVEDAPQPSVPPLSADVLEIPLGRDVDVDTVRLYAFPGWGLYLWRGDGLLVSFRCGPLGLAGTGNHDHNDQLALTLHLDGRDRVGDPGTYRYTADAAERDAYRSVAAHFAPRLHGADREPGSLDDGPWVLGDQAQARMEICGDDVLQGAHRGYGVPVHRRLVLHRDCIVVSDWADGDLDLLPLSAQFAALDADGCALAYCPDYGVRHA